MDPQLVKLAQKGDERAFEAIVVAVHPTLFRVAYGILRDAELAEDATQRACLDTWRFLARLRDREGFEAWALGHLLAACRAAADEAPSLDSDAVEEPARPSSADPFGTVLDRDEVARAFRQLSFDERAVLVLHYLVGLQPGQAESALGLGAEALAGRVEEALETLSAAIDGDPASPDKLVAQPEGA
jgi:RNA polymerase sigma-70 factor (ECF subfamily)